MSYSKIEQLCIELAEPIAKENGCFIYDVEFVKEGSLKFLRIYADKEGGISLDECELISRALSEVLDKKDPIKENYYLEVSSPGIERKLKTPEHFKRYIGEKIDLSFYKALNGSKQLCCTLINYENNVLKIESEDYSGEISINDISTAKLHFEF